MKIFFIIIIITLSCVACGKKSDPEYKSFNYKNNTVKII